MTVAAKQEPITFSSSNIQFVFGDLYLLLITSIIFLKTSLRSRDFFLKLFQFLIFHSIEFVLRAPMLNAIRFTLLSSNCIVIAS